MLPGGSFDARSRSECSGSATQISRVSRSHPIDGEALVHVRAAGLHPIVRARASGSHYSSSEKVPFVAGLDGVGVLDDGRRVYFVFGRQPWGTMAELAAAPMAMSIPLPDDLDDVHAAAIVNPGMSAWMTLSERGAPVKGETVLIQGATGVAGQLAIQVARHLGAKRIIASGRNVDALASADVDAIVRLTDSDDAIRTAYSAEVSTGIDLIVDYLWGRPTELLLEALATGFSPQATSQNPAGGGGRERRQHHHPPRRAPAQNRSHATRQRIRRGLA